MGGPSLLFLPGSGTVCCAALFAALAWRSRLDITRTLPASVPQTTYITGENRQPVPVSQIARGMPITEVLLELPEGSMPCSHFQTYPNVDCTPVLRVCVAWGCLFFAFLFFQSAQKFYAHSQLRRDSKKTDDGDRPPSFAAVKYGSAGAKYGTLTGDRTVGNMLEQAVPFFLFLYLHATVIDVRTAAKYGWYWLLSRSIYPVVFSKGLQWLFLSTLPGYAFIGTLAWPIFQLAMAPESSGRYGPE